MAKERWGYGLEVVHVAQHHTKSPSLVAAWLRLQAVVGQRTSNCTFQ